MLCLCKYFVLYSPFVEFLSSRLLTSACVMSLIITKLLVKLNALFKSYTSLYYPFRCGIIQIVRVRAKIVTTHDLLMKEVVVFGTMSLMLVSSVTLNSYFGE